MRSFLGVGLALILTACGSNRGGLTTPLTEDQRTQFSGTLQSIGRAEQAGAVANNRPHRNTQAQKDEVTAEMADAILAANCDIKLDMPNGNQSQDPFNSSQAMKMQVGGNSCPVSLDMAFNQKQDINFQAGSLKITMDFFLKYAVKDEKFSKLNDITAMDLSGKADISGSNNSLNGDINVEGKLTSNQYGALTFYVVGKVSGSGSDENSSKVEKELVFGVEYPEFAAELKWKATTQGQTTENAYFLNGQTITEAEYQAEIQKLGTITQLKP